MSGSFCNFHPLSSQDINLKTAKSNQVMHFTFRDDKHWKLQQIQDARNHVNQALQLLSGRDESYHFKTGAEVNKVGTHTHCYHFKTGAEGNEVSFHQGKLII
uniref:Protein rogdi homolog n=1 Tax=Hucho hucho TaxID=62062 RepID=A0A4W5KTJ7_9TELE